VVGSDQHPLGRVLEMAQSSPEREGYETKIRDRFGEQREFDFVLPDQPLQVADKNPVAS
jgi:hypothetical protein